jgi:hypothetical protein
MLVPGLDPTEGFQLVCDAIGKEIFLAGLGMSVTKPEQSTNLRIWAQRSTGS